MGCFFFFSPWGLYSSFSVQRKLENEREGGSGSIRPKGMQLIKWNAENRMWTQSRWHWSHIALYSVYMFGKSHRLPLSLSLATLGVLILKITRGQRRILKALPLGCTAIHLFDNETSKAKFSKIIFHWAFIWALFLWWFLTKVLLPVPRGKTNLNVKRDVKNNVICWQNLRGYYLPFTQAGS